MKAGRADNDRYDVVIAGGGMVGASLALALQPLGLRVAMVEPVARHAGSQPSFDDRSTALSRSSQRMFEALGVWDAIEEAAAPITAIHVSDRGRFGFAHIDAEEQGVEALGHVVINRVLGGVIADALNAGDGPDVLCPARIVEARLGPEQATVGLDDGRTLAARLLVAADGAASAVRSMAGIAVRKTDYGQRAVIGNLRTGKPLAGRAYERFTEAGPLAILPVAGERAAFVWNVPEADAERRLGLGDAAFLAELQRVFGYRLGEFSHVGERASYPLMLTRAARLTAQRVVLVGNAAHGLHPAAAQGFNLGLRDVAALCDCLADAPGDAGAATLIGRYAAWRRRDQQKLVRFTDGLVRLFGSASPPLRVARGVAMAGFDLVPGVRRLFARHTMGLAGRLPRLSRGVPLR
jgi:2-octaprenyl-6-methoxyphenol hydroxylase